jgi:hypothetical protein
MLTRDSYLSSDLYPVDYYLVPSGICMGTIRLPSGIHHLVLGKPPSDATFSGKNLGLMLF